MITANKSTSRWARGKNFCFTPPPPQPGSMAASGATESRIGARQPCNVLLPPALLLSAVLSCGWPRIQMCFLTWEIHPPHSPPNHHPSPTRSQRLAICTFKFSICSTADKARLVKIKKKISYIYFLKKPENNQSDTRNRCVCVSENDISAVVYFSQSSVSCCENACGHFQSHTLT